MSRQFLLALLAFLAFISLGLPDGLVGVSWPSISATFAVPLGPVEGMNTSATSKGATAARRLSMSVCSNSWPT